MFEKIYSNPDIYNIYVPLPNNPLKNLNCYVVKTEERNLIIDTGFNLKECYSALTEGIKELEIDMSQTDLFLTHLHSDHTGLAPFIADNNSVIYMSKTDYEYLYNESPEYSWDALYRKFISEGFPIEAIKKLHTSNPAEAYAPEKSFKAVTLNDGDKIDIGNYCFTCVYTPGHTPGHMCLYLESEKLMFLGDHVLFDITPNITFWTGVRDSLKDYMESLEKIKAYDVKTALPAHRKNEMDFYERIDQITAHHTERLNECFGIIKENPGLNAYDIAGFMKWSMRGRNWQEFPMHQKWFAVGEAIAHIDYLRGQNKVFRKLENGIYRYYAF